MALINSLTSGVTALKSFTRGMEVIGDNIANVNTTAFKSSRIDYTDSFSNMLRNSSSSNGNASNVTSSQLGTGVKVQTVASNFNQGFIDNTGVETDLAVAGEGFFRVIDPVNNTEYATRAGNFRIDDNGNMVTTDGFRLQGLMGGAIEYDVFLDAGNNLVYQIRDGFPTPYDGDTIADLNVQPPQLNTTTGSLRVHSTAPVGFSAIPLNNQGVPYPLSELDTQLAAATPTTGPAGSQGFSFGGNYTSFQSMMDQVAVKTISTTQFSRAIAAENGGNGLEIFSGGYTTVADLETEAADASKATEINTALAAMNAGAGIAIGGNNYTTLAAIRTDIDAATITEVAANAALDAINGGGGLLSSSTNYTSLSDIRSAINDETIMEADADRALAAANSGNGITPLFTSLSELRSGIDATIVSVADINSALASSSVTIDGTTYDGSSGSGWADLNALYKINKVTGDTYSLADINQKSPRVSSFSFDVQGNLNITMSDGNSYTQGKLLLMNFSDPQALVKEGDGLYTGFDAAGVVGSFTSNTPGENGLGKILQRSLEQSNVDLTAEFANMITVQRSFQAGSRVVTVSDEILNEVVNLKR